MVAAKVHEKNLKRLGKISRNMRVKQKDKTHVINPRNICSVTVCI